MLATATVLLAISACGGGDDDDDTVKDGDTFYTPFGTATTIQDPELPFPQLSFPECSEPIAKAAEEEELGFDPVEDAGVPPPPEDTYDHLPEGGWEWICGGG